MTPTIILALLAIKNHNPQTTPKFLPIQTTHLEIPRPGQRALSLAVTYPATGGPYPAIVFSHGMYGSQDGNTPLAEHWAKNGFVILRPTHADSARYLTPDQRRAMLQGNLDNMSNWRERPGEITLVIDQLPKIESLDPALAGKIDPQKIGVGGHSYGAWTTQMVAGMAFHVGGQTLSLADARPKAFFALAPHGLTPSITPQSFQSMRTPMLLVSGDNDRGRFQGPPAVHRRQAFDHTRGGQNDLYLLWIKDAYHNFGGATSMESPDSTSPQTQTQTRTRAADSLTRRLGMAGPPNPEQARAVLDTSLHFWNAHLKNDPEAHAWLQSKQIEKRPGNTLSIK